MDKTIPLIAVFVWWSSIACGVFFIMSLYNRAKQNLKESQELLHETDTAYRSLLTSLRNTENKEGAEYIALRQKYNKLTQAYRNEMLFVSERPKKYVKKEMKKWWLHNKEENNGG